MHTRPYRLVRRHLFTEEQCRQLVVNQGYKVMVDKPGAVTVSDKTGGNQSNTWSGVSFKDIVVSFKLDERVAK